MTKLEIIKEVLEDVYCKNPSLRAIEHDENKKYFKCSYELKNVDGTVLLCAVGMCLTSEGVIFAMDNHIGEVYYFGDVEPYLQEKYQGHSINFWADLQKFHDYSVYFTETGISEKGTIRLQELKRLYA
jgi:hypothetical protein